MNTDYEPDEKPRWSLSEVIGAILVIVFLCALAAGAVWMLLMPTKALGQTPVVPAAQLFRDVVFPNDPDRAWTCIWHRGDPTDPNSFGFFQGGFLNEAGGDPVWDSVQLVDAAGQRWNVDHLCVRQQNWLEAAYYRCFTVPANVPSGTYSIVLNATTQGTLRVATWKKLYTTLTGNRNSLTMEPGRAYYAYGVTITGNVTGAPGASLIGATVVDGLSLFAENMVVKDCTFRRGSVGTKLDWSNPAFPYADHGILYQNCLFDHASCSGCSSGCFLNCKWTGRISYSGPAGVMGAANGHNFVTERAKRLCFFNATFDGTDRGPVLRTNWGDNSDSLICGMNVLNVNATTNGNEAICFEGNGLASGRCDRNIILGFRAFNTTNHVQWWNIRASGNLVANGLFGRGCTVAFSGLEEQKDNVVRYNQFSEPIKTNYAGGTKAAGTVDLDNTIKP